MIMITAASAAPASITATAATTKLTPPPPPALLLLLLLLPLHPTPPPPPFPRLLSLPQFGNLYHQHIFSPRWQLTFGNLHLSWVFIELWNLANMISYVYIVNCLNYSYLSKNDRFLASILHCWICPWEISNDLVFNIINFAVPFRYQGALVALHEYF